MNNYIIAVDRDGQPYIAHAWGRGANGQHKYIAKIGEGAKARYFYTQEQLRAFQQGGRQKAQDAANKAKEKISNAVGISQRKEALASAKRYENAVRNSSLARAVERRFDQEAKSKVGSGEEFRKAAKAAEAIKRESTKASDRASKAYRDQHEKWEAYDKTPLSKLENAVDKVKDTVQDLEDKRKEIQNKHTTIEKGSHTVEEWKNSEKGQKYMKNVSTSEGGHKLNKSQFSEYKKGDSDFDDKNFKEKNRVGDSDFFMAKRPDGSTVILEEDMKWIIPKGVDPNSPAIKAALTKEYKADSNDEWVKQVTEAIDDALVKSNKKI